MPRYERMDEMTGWAVTIDGPHHEVHEGDMWQCNVSSTSVANDKWLSLATNGAIGIQAHFTFTGELDGTALLELIEGATYSTTGSTTASTVAYNMHRGKSPSTYSIIKNSSAVSGGTTLVTEVIPGGEAKQSAPGAAGTRPGLEWITDPTKTYIVRLTNKAGAAKAASVAVNFYTHSAGAKSGPSWG